MASTQLKAYKHVNVEDHFVHEAEQIALHTLCRSVVLGYCNYILYLASMDKDPM